MGRYMPRWLDCKGWHKKTPLNRSQGGNKKKFFVDYAIALIRLASLLF